MGDAAGVLAQGGAGGDGGAGRDFAFDPGAEGFLGRDAAGGFEAGDEGGGVVAGGVGEVFEVEGGFDGRVVAGEVELPGGAGARDVGGHAEGVDGGVVAEAGGVEAEGNLVAVHHEVCGGVGAGDGFVPEEDAGVRVHGGLVGGDGAVELPHDDGFRVVEEVVADAGDVLDQGNVEGLELVTWADAGEEE